MKEITNNPLNARPQYGLLLVLLGVLFPIVALSAEVGDAVSKVNYNYVFRYDAAGNRVSRSVGSIAAKGATGSSTDIGEVTVAPTVTTGDVTVRTTADLFTAPLSYTVSNLTGTCVDDGQLIAQVTRLSLPNASGVYILSVRSKQSSKSFKIVRE